MAEIVWKRGAEDDLLRIFAEQEEFQEGAGERLTRQLDATLQRLRSHPQMAPIFERPMRRLVVGNLGYGLFYRRAARDHYSCARPSEPKPRSHPRENTSLAWVELNDH